VEAAMISKRRIILFLIVIAVMLLVKYASGQDTVQAQLGWDEMSVCYADHMALDVVMALFYGLMFGIASGLYRVRSRNMKFSTGHGFDPELVCLRLS
jgi:hypothetical protein